MHKVQLITKLLLQLGTAIMTTYIGTEVQKISHPLLVGSIAGLFLFYLLLQFKIIPLTWVGDGINFSLETMVFFFISSVIGIMDIVSETMLNYILFLVVITMGTCIAALSSDCITERMSAKHR